MTEGPGTARVASVGSINVDRVAYLDAEALADLAATHDWFPSPGETRRAERVPEAVRALAGATFEGGKGANQAVAAARAGADAALYGKVGHDHGPFGVLDALVRRGVDAGAVEEADDPTGAAHVFVAPDGENYIVVVGGANAAVDRAYVERRLPAIARAGAVVVQNELPVATSEAIVAALSGDGGPTVVCNPAPVDGAEHLLAAGPDVAVVNETEYDALRDRLAGLPVVVRTRGGDPVVVEGAAVEGFTVAPPAVDPVDTTGAGDVFTGYLAAELARGATLRAGVETAVVAAALSTRGSGVQRSTPALGRVQAARGRRG
jgi:ribokinase